MTKASQPAPVGRPGTHAARAAVLALALILVAGSLFGAQAATARESGTTSAVGPGPQRLSSASPLAAPSITEISQYLIIGMKPSAAGEAVTIGSSQEIGADRQTLSGGNPGDPQVSPITPSITPAYPAPSSPNLRDVYFKDGSAPTDPTKNRWLWDNTNQAHYLPGPSNSKLFLFRGVDWSGDVAVTSASGTFSLQDINVFGQFGFRATNQSAPVNISNSYYFDDPSLTGTSMDSLDNSLPAPDSPSQGWDGGYNHTQLLTDLRLWRDYIRGLPRDTFFNSGDGSNPRDLVNRNSIDNNAGGKLMYDVASLDANDDGTVVVDIAYDGTDFEVNNSDWVIYNSDPANPKFVIFRIRGQANMNMSNASIMVGDGIVCGANGLGVLFVKAHPEEEFVSTSGSSDQVFNANNLVVSKVGFWDLNTIGDASTDTDYPAPSDSSVYLSGSGGMPNTDYVNRGQQGNYTQLAVNNGQGCSQFVSPFVYFQNVRWIKCSQCAALEYDLGDLPDTGTGTGSGNYQTLLADSGPRHTITGPWMGAAVDSEADGQPNASATGDDLNGATPDDEDGVTIPTLVAGQTATVVVNSSAAAKLNAFFDWNNDGDFNDAGEVIAELAVIAGNNNLSVPVPANAIAGTPVGARFRLSTAGGLGPTGDAPDGEIEDYLVTVVRPGAIGNYVWVDENSDGYQDAGEPGIPNVRIDLKDCTSGNILATTYTDAHGGYLFTNLAPGTYCVDVDESTLPPGMTQTPYNLPGADFGNQNHSGNGYQVVLPSGGENLTADFGYNYNPTACVDNPDDPACNDDTATIGDRVWVDADGDGAQDPNEVGIPGVCVELFTAGPDNIFGTPDDVSLGTQNTDANGNYLFDGLAPGAYVVRMCASNFQPGGPLDGYSQTGDPDHFGQPGGVNDNQTTTPVILAPGDVFLNADFGYQPPVCGQIGDTIWFDADADGSGPALAPIIGGAPVNQGNGLQNDSSETGIPGVTVALIRDLNADGIWDADEPIIGTTATDAAGQYLFPCLDTTNGTGSDDYLVWVNDTDNVLGGKTPTYDKDGGAAPSGSDAPVGVASSTVLGLSAVPDLDTTPVMDQDFGYTAPGQTNVLGLIGDRVWLDIDSDGVQDPNEPGLEGVTVTLKDNNGNTVGVTTTDENGYYYFGGLPAGTYTVVVTPPAGLTQTYDADDGLAPFTTPHQSTVTIGPGGINLDQDFGYVGTGTVGNLVWEDLDADGFADPNEPGIDGVTIDLYWDQNGNGKIDPGEPLVGSTVTGDNPATPEVEHGWYLFEGLPVDDGGGNAQFVVDVTDDDGVLNGFWHSLGTPGQDNNSQTDPYAVTLTPGTPNNLTADFGYYVKPGCLGNFVWLDADGDGIQDAGEPGTDDVKVTLLAKYAGSPSTTLVVRSGDDAGTVAGEKGWYGFCNLLLDEDHASSKAGSPTPTQPVYSISVTTPLGYAPTLVDQGANDMVDSDNHAGVDGLATQGQTDVTQNANANAETNPIAGYDFGFTTNLDFGDLPDQPYPTLLASNGAGHAIVSGVSLGGAPDAEPNGQPNAAATGDDLAGTTPDDEDGVVFLTPLMPGTTAKIQVTITDSDGTACLSAFIDFDGNGTLDPVTYTAIDAVPGAGTVGDLVLSSGVHTLTISVPGTTTGITPSRFRLTDACGEGGNSPTGLATSGEVEDYALASIGDYVWNDTNGNGQQDGGEPPQSGVTVNLLDGSGNPVLDAGGNPITTVTDGSGNYEFPGLPPGTYIVEFVPPPNTAVTTPNQGNDSTDSDADQVTGRSGPVTVNPGDSDDTVDAGLVAPSGVAIGNLVFCDFNGNGIQDAGDNGQGGVTVNLYGLGADATPYTPDDPLVATTTTNANGFYLFQPVTPGQYYLAVVSSTVPPSCGVRSSTGGGGDPDLGDHDLPNGDDGIPGVTTGEVVTGVVNATVGGQTTPDTGNPLGYADASAYMTVDFGFTNDPNAISLRSWRAQSISLIDLLIDWLRNAIRW